MYSFSKFITLLYEPRNNKSLSILITRAAAPPAQHLMAGAEAVSRLQSNKPMACDSALSILHQALQDGMAGLSRSGQDEVEGQMGLEGNNECEIYYRMLFVGDRVIPNMFTFIFIVRTAPHHGRSSAAGPSNQLDFHYITRHPASVAVWQWEWGSGCCHQHNGW